MKEPIMLPLTKFMGEMAMPEPPPSLAEMGKKALTGRKLNATGKKKAAQLVETLAAAKVTASKARQKEGEAEMGLMRFLAEISAGMHDA